MRREAISDGAQSLEKGYKLVCRHVLQNLVRAGAIHFRSVIVHIVRGPILNPRPRKVIPSLELAAEPASCMPDQIQLRQPLDVARDDLPHAKRPEGDRNGQIASGADFQDRSRKRIVHGTVVRYDAPGDSGKSIKRSISARPVPRDVALQEVVRLSPAGEIERTERKCFKPPIHDLALLRVERIVEETELRGLPGSHAICLTLSPALLAPAGLAVGDQPGIPVLLRSYHPIADDGQDHRWCRKNYPVT
jgi:hypothetical protein